MERPLSEASTCWHDDSLTTLSARLISRLTACPAVTSASLLYAGHCPVVQCPLAALSSSEPLPAISRPSSGCLSVCLSSEWCCSVRRDGAPCGTDRPSKPVAVLPGPLREAFILTSSVYVASHPLYVASPVGALRPWAQSPTL